MHRSKPLCLSQPQRRLLIFRNRALWSRFLPDSSVSTLQSHRLCFFHLRRCRLLLPEAPALVEPPTAALTTPVAVTSATAQKSAALTAVSRWFQIHSRATAAAA